MPVTAYSEREIEMREALRGLAIDEGSLARPLSRCELSRCRTMCCHDGVYLSHDEREVVVELFGEGMVESDRERWKTRTRPAEANETGDGFPSHFPKTRCVFLDENHLCGFQKRACAEGRHPWFYKPMPCWLHPLTITRLPNGRPMLTLPSPEDDPQAKAGYPGFASCTTCGMPALGGRPAREVLAEEIRFLRSLLDAED